MAWVAVGRADATDVRSTERRPGCVPAWRPPAALLAFAAPPGVAFEVRPQVFMIFLPTLRFLMRPLPPGFFAARFFAAVIRPPLLFLAMGIDLLVGGSSSRTRVPSYTLPWAFSSVEGVTGIR